MPDSPFVGDDMISGGAIPEEKKDYSRQRRDAAMGVAAGLLPILPVGKLLQAASTPLKRAGIGVAGGGVIGGAGEAMGQEKKEADVFPSPMHELQARLKKQGLLPPSFKVDGQSHEGAATEKAIKRLKDMFGDGEPLHVLRMMQDPEYKKSNEAQANEKRKNEATIATAKAGEAETKRKGELDKRIKDAAAEGESWGGMAKRWAPYLIGGGLGGLAGGAVGFKHNRAAKATAREADDFATKHFKGAPVTPDNVADQAAAVNTFYERGKGQSPFTKITTSGELSPKSLSYQVADQTPPGDLFKIKPKAHALAATADVGAGGLAAADYFLAGHNSERNKVQADEARDRFKVSGAAHDAVAETHARGRSELWSGAQNMALPFASLYAALRFKGVPMKAQQPKMETMQATDATRLRVQDYLNRQSAGGPQSVLAGKGGAPAPIHGGQLKALPAPAAPAAPGGALPAPAPANNGGIGAHHTVMNKAKLERSANTDKVFTGSMAQTTDQLINDRRQT